MPEREPLVAIVDYGLGNLFSVQQACRTAGLASEITSERERVIAADAVILPGVGAFGNAMSALTRLDLLAPLRDIAASDRPLIGICLGFQLLMTESTEFGSHRGLGIFDGTVEQLPGDRPQRLKVPHVGWNRVTRAGGASWQESPLAGVGEGTYMYFVHSYYVRPASTKCWLSSTRYGELEFCSSVRRGNVFAAQFHPERSGARGLAIYRHLREQLATRSSHV